MSESNSKGKLFCKNPQRGIVRSNAISTFSFLKTLCADFHIDLLVYIPTNSVEGFLFPTI